MNLPLTTIGFRYYPFTGSLTYGTSDIVSKRNVVIIRQSKGKKRQDRTALEKMLELLQDYNRAYNLKYRLFENQGSE